MKEYTRGFGQHPLTYGIWGLLVALVFAVALSGCGDDKTTINQVPTSTVGSLNVNVNPVTATVVVAGPDSYTQTFTGNQLLTDLAPGQYTATATASGFVDAASAINVVAGQTSSITLALEMTQTVGSLNVDVNPASATVVVAGPGSYTQTFTGNQLLTDLAPGQYRATATAPGFVDAAKAINVVAGQTSSISLILDATAVLNEVPRAVYRNGQGNLIPFDLSNLQSGQFVFYAWLQDKPSGIVPAGLTSTTISGDPGMPLVAEQEETAPSFTQNLAVAWVGYRDAAGDIWPVIGADVRWEIDQYYSGRLNSMQFGTSDDNRVGLGYGVLDDQADTRTNNAHLEVERFPFAVSEYPLYNLTGVGTPFADGFTWVTLFSPDREAAGRMVAVATINGEEIGKQILYKHFAPTPELQITKTVDADVVNLSGGTADATWTVTVENVGLGAATNVDLTDILASGDAASYTLSGLPAGSVAVGDGFTYSFSLASGNSVDLTFTATVTAPGTYCNEGQILAYNDATSTWAPIDLKSQACFTALESNLSIIKDFVAADGTTSLGKTLTVEADAPAQLRVRVINNGSGAATGIDVNDLLDLSDLRTTGVLADYTLSNLSAGTANADGGFDITIANLAAGATSTPVLFTVAGSVDGVYCDTATIGGTTSGAAIGIGSDTACLTVATPILTITKTIAPASILPGASYTSTIIVSNIGTATADDVVISDLLGLNSAANVRAIYTSSSLNGTGGTLANNIVTSNTATILAGESLTFTLVSRIPLAAASGTYCDTASVESSNAVSPEPVEACVDVPAFSALQTQLIDLADPIAVGNNVTYFSTLYVEALSNEGVGQGELIYSFGLSSPTGIGTAGVFQLISTQVYLDTAPVRDPVTGVVVSDTSNATAVLLTEGTDYSVDNSTVGRQVITMAPGVILQPDTARYLVHKVLVPSGTPTNHLYTTSYIWNSVGLVNPSNTYEASSSEPTTVLP